MNKWFLVLIFALLGLVSLPAATVSILVIETGLPPGTTQTESASVWESGIMDVCFDAGHIVSNAPAMVLPAVTAAVLPQEAQRDFDEARLGGADFFIMVLLRYAGAPAAAVPETSAEAVTEAAAETKQPKVVSIAVFRVSSGELLYETSVSAHIWGSSGEEFLDVKRNAGRILPRLVLKG
ncbi:hypothetical protein AGMMS50230_22190 [Spirochaetia bacterium]|nr:hypothetical protein AGMMS50230_22190 [Spirochaetia bacterium]